MKKIISLIVVIVIAIGGYYWWHNSHPAKIKANPAVPVVLGVATAHDMPIFAEATGTTAAYQLATIEPKVAGYIAKINFHDGQYVHKGDVLFVLAAPHAHAQVHYSKVNAQILQKIYEANKTLPKGDIATQDLATNHANAITAQQTYLTNLINYNDTVIRAPFSGYVTARQVHVGDFVNVGDTLVQLVNNKTLRVIYDLPAHDAHYLKLGDSVFLTTADQGSKRFEAHVSYVAPLVDASTQTIEVHALVDNSKKLLRSGEVVQLQQVLAMQPNVITIPSIALLGWDSGYYVYIDKNGKAVEQPITIGNIDNGNVVVTSGLKVGDKYLVKGQHVVDDNSPLKVVPASKSNA